LHETNRVVSVETSGIEGMEDGGQIRARQEILEIIRQQVAVFRKPAVGHLTTGELIDGIFFGRQIFRPLPRQEPDHRGIVIEHMFDCRLAHSKLSSPSTGFPKCVNSD
jgi:hypothetical protein